jgi:hypothetical protein
MPAKRPEFKIFVRVTEETYNRFSEWAARVGLTKSQFGNLCIQAGLSAVVQAVSPADAFSPDQLVAIIEAAKKKGLDIDIEQLKEKGRDSHRSEQ